MILALSRTPITNFADNPERVSFAESLGQSLLKGFNDYVTCHPLTSNPWDATSLSYNIHIFACRKGYDGLAFAVMTADP
jgi:hypothetical protein